MADEDELITVVADWRLDIAGGRTYGICQVDVSPPYEALSMKRGFPLTNPSHARCAAFSLLMGMEIVLSTPKIMRNAAVAADSSLPPPPPGYMIALVTRSKAVYDAMIGDDTDRVRRWVAGDARKPLDVFGYRKPFWLNLLSKYDYLSADTTDAAHTAGGRGTRSRAKLIYKPITKEEEEGNMLASHSVNLDIDPQKDYNPELSKKDAAKDDTEALLASMRARSVLRDELFEATGARSSRRGRKQTKREKMAVLEKDRRMTEKKERDGDRGQGEAAAQDAGTGGGVQEQEPGTAGGK
jgi:hypothetical protein